jgi:hypothetical protein
MVYKDSVNGVAPLYKFFRIVYCPLKRPPLKWHCIGSYNIEFLYHEASDVPDGFETMSQCPVLETWVHYESTGLPGSVNVECIFVLYSSQKGDLW